MTPLGVGTGEKCRCKQGVTVSRVSLYPQLFSRPHNTMIPFGVKSVTAAISVALTGVTVSGEVCILTRFNGVLEIVEPLLVFLPRNMYLDLLTGIQLSVAHAAVVLQVGGRPERAERVGDVVRCREVHSMSVRATNNAITRTIAIGRGTTVSLNPR